ncbi:histidine kinase [Paenibacillus sp. FSL K6-0276]|uniref:sensor histidine kinase n=1 Tax=Paenibacillus sp. FSL K6-0276 TaxID=2921450 RepID=UPI0030EC4133
MIKFKRIQSKLFVSYSSLILVILFSLGISFYFSTAHVLKKQASESNLQLSLNLSDKLDSQFKYMDSIAERVISAQPVKQLFFSKSTDTEVTILHNKWDITSMLFSITGTPFQFYQMNLFDLNGHFVKFGKEYDVHDLDPNIVRSKEWIQPVLQLDGKRSISMPRLNDWDNSESIIISLSRAFSEVFGAKVDSIVEIQQEYKEFENLIERSVNPANDQSSLNFNVYVYNSEGDLVYPHQPGNTNLKDLSPFYWNSIQDKTELHNTFTIKNSYNHGSESVSYTRSEFTGWTVALIQSESILLEPVINFRNDLLFFGIIILFITMIVTFFVSKSLTIPIRRIRKSIKTLSLDTLNPRLNNNVSLNELEELNQSFLDMCDRLKSSLEETVSAKSHEIQARLFALQAQMNPHFLYNTLAIISIKAENNNQDEIVEMCHNLSEMLRYIAVEGSKSVTIADELDYMLKYLELMKIRYMKQFNYDIDIPEEMNDIQVPRLLIQPIIENCFKHAFTQKPPWNIAIKGVYTAQSWKITISDNGTGFDKQTYIQIMDKVNNQGFKYGEEAESLDRIGLINIYYRLKILYNHNVIFEISNDHNSGAIITIGGSRSDGGD